jgi:hypothetical protein
MIFKNIWLTIKKKEKVAKILENYNVFILLESQEICTIG